MGALRQPKLSEPKKPPVAETRKLDRYGRDPESPLEKLRVRTDYETGNGWAAFPHAAFVDMLRLASGAVCWQFVTAVNIALASTGAKSPKDYWNGWTEMRTCQQWAESCGAGIRDVQRQLSELEERGMIAVKKIKRGRGGAAPIEYSISLLYAKWRGLEDYAVWKRRQVVVIDQVQDDEVSDDEAPAEISKDAVHLTKKPQAVRPGRASRAVKVSVGVRELSFQNDSPAVDAAFSAVVTSGRLVVSATFKSGESEAKGEVKANAERHACRELPPNEGSKNPPTKRVSHERAAEVVNLFDPLLQRSGGRLLSPDTTALQTACSELGNLPHDFLVHWVMKPGGRGARPIAGPRAVAAIIRECRLNWEKSNTAASEIESQERRCACGGPGEVFWEGLLECWACHDKRN